MQHIAVNGMPSDRIEGVSWRKSRRSAPGGNCVEIAVLPGGQMAMRNSRHPQGPALVCSREELAAFLCGAREGEFDLLLGEAVETGGRRLR